MGCLWCRLPFLRLMLPVTRCSLLDTVRRACGSVWSGGWPDYDHVSFPDYVQSSYLYIPYTYGLSAWVYEWVPFEANCDFRNCVYGLADLDSETGFLTTGFDDFYWPFRLYRASTYEFTDYGNYGTIPTVLSAAETQWLHPGWWRLDLGISLNGDDLTMAAGERNYYGLALLSAKVAWVGQNPLQTFTVSAGGSITLPGLDEYSDWLYFYPETAQPQLQNAGWYFGQGYAVVLGWRNVTGNPAIRLYRSCETNGATAYLTDTNVALEQFSESPSSCDQGSNAAGQSR